MRSDTAVFMSAWRRPQYLRKTLASWARADGVRDVSRFVIGLDPHERKPQMLEVIEEGRRVLGRDIDVFENPERYDNLGNPLISGNRMFAEDEHLRFLVFAEEDLLVSDDVLRYFAWCKDKFRYRKDVLVAGAHTASENPRADEDPAAVSFACRFRVWVWGVWRDRWEEVLRPTWDRDYSSGTPEQPQSGYDWNLDLRVMPRGGYLGVYPAASRSQNIGKFEGIHADPGAYAGTLNPSFREHFGHVDYRLALGNLS